MREKSGNQDKLNNEIATKISDKQCLYPQGKFQFSP